jgi:hypothetical protein
MNRKIYYVRLLEFKGFDWQTERFQFQVSISQPYGKTAV